MCWVNIWHLHVWMEYTRALACQFKTHALVFYHRSDHNSIKCFSLTCFAHLPSQQMNLLQAYISTIGSTLSGNCQLNIRQSRVKHAVIPGRRLVLVFKRTNEGGRGRPCGACHICAPFTCKFLHVPLVYPCITPACATSFWRISKVANLLCSHWGRGIRRRQSSADTATTGSPSPSAMCKEWEKSRCWARGDCCTYLRLLDYEISCWSLTFQSAAVDEYTQNGTVNFDANPGRAGLPFHDVLFSAFSLWDYHLLSLAQDRHTWCKTARRLHGKERPNIVELTWSTKMKDLRNCVVTLKVNAGLYKSACGKKWGSYLCHLGLAESACQVALHTAMNSISKHWTSQFFFRASSTLDDDWISPLQQ